MDWLFNLHQTNPVAQAIIALSLVCVLGMAGGSLKVRGIGLGASGVLFAGIVIGHFSRPIDHATLEFVKEFGLILFVFCIGLQLGPGFFASLRRGGMRLNGLALGIVLLGVAAALLFGRLFRIESEAVLGVYSGAVTNTPSLGAAQQALATFPGADAERAVLPSLAYAVTYPAGILGIIGSLLALRMIFRIDAAAEAAAYGEEQKSGIEPLERRTLAVENPRLEGAAIAEVTALLRPGVLLSRIRRKGAESAELASSATIVRQGDLLQAVGAPPALDQAERVIGPRSGENLMTVSGAVANRRLMVTQKAVLGARLADLNLEAACGAIITRVVRGETEMIALPELRLQFGDSVNVVGPAAALDEAERRLGNSTRALNETQFVPLFAGIAAGIALGTMPIAFPGLPQPLRIGLAGGPLVVALAVGRVGRIGRLVWHMPRNANLAFREFGIALFFASVGLLAGPKFFAAVASATGVKWLLAGACVTVVPLLAAGAFARGAWGMNFIPLSGCLAGSMTDPPALAFANNVCGSEAPSLAYATVYPLTMLLRIATAQAMAVALCG